MSVGTSYKTTKALDAAYDTAVIGSGIGGLSVAALLARQGQRVLVLERHYTAGGATQTWKRKGYEWDVGLHYMGEVHKPKSVLRQIFDDITDAKLTWAPMPDVYNRIVIEDRAYAYVSGASRFKERMKTYFPHEAAAIDRYVELVFEANRTAQAFYAQRALPPSMGDALYDQMSTGFRAFSDRTTLSVLEELTKDRELIAVLTGHYGDYGLDPSKSAFAVHAMLIRHYIEGANFPVGGSGRIAETIAPVIEAAGGAIVTSAEVSGILLERGRAAGVRMRDGREIRVPRVISDAGVANTITKLLPEDVAHASGLDDGLRRVEPSISIVCLNLGVRASASALGLDPANVWSHPSNDYAANYARYEADPERAPIPFHFITFASAKDPTWEERFPGRATVDICSATTFAEWRPFDEQPWKKRGAAYEEKKAKVTEALMRQVLRFAPQIEGKVEHAELATPLTFKHFAARDQGDFIGLAHTPERFRQRWLRPHTPIEGLFLTGQDITSDGVSGAMMGGVLAASAVLGRNVLDDVKARRGAASSS